MIDVGQLYEAHRRELTIHVARQMHGEPPQDIEDVVQQAFAKAVRTSRTYEDRGYEPKAWLYTIATNLIIDRRRRGSRKTEDGYQDRLTLCRIGPTEKAVATVQPDYARIENSLTLQPALDALTTAQRKAIVLRFWYGFSSTEIGYLMGTTESCVKKFHVRALASMRKMLSEGACESVSGKAAKADELAAAMLARSNEGLTQLQIAFEFGTSRDVVKRMLQRARNRNLVEGVAA